MALLSINSTPAERRRYCTFSESFISSRHVVENGGDINGAPPVDFGITLDGAGDYVAYNLASEELNSSSISIIAEFYPDFGTDTDAVYTIMHTSVPLYVIHKRANADNNTLRVYLGNTVIVEVPEATYSPYWLVGQRNVLGISCTSGTNVGRLNGNQIFSVATAWTPGAVTTLYLGANSAGNDEFDGILKCLKVLQVRLTNQEIDDYYNYGVRS